MLTAASNGSPKYGINAGGETPCLHDASFLKACLLLQSYHRLRCKKHFSATCPCSLTCGCFVDVFVLLLPLQQRMATPINTHIEFAPRHHTTNPNGQHSLNISLHPAFNRDSTAYPSPFISTDTDQNASLQIFQHVKSRHTQGFR